MNPTDDQLLDDLLDHSITLPAIAKKHALTLENDSNKKRFVGSWIGSMMDCMFTYEGALDAAGKSLPLDTMGPSFADPAKTVKCRDTYAWVDENLRTLTSAAQNDDGTLTTFMAAHHRRVKT